MKKSPSHLMAAGPLALVLLAAMTGCVTMPGEPQSFAYGNGQQIVAGVRWAENVQTNKADLGVLQVDNEKHLIRNWMRYALTAVAVVGADYATDGDVLGIFDDGGGGSGAGSPSSILDPDRATVTSTGNGSSINVKDAPSDVAFPITINASGGGSVDIDFKVPE